MSTTTTREVFNNTVLAGSTTTVNIPLAEHEILGVLVVMTDATNVADIGDVDLFFYDGAKPTPVLTNLPVPTSSTLGPALTGNRCESFFVYDISCFMEGEISVVNNAGSSRDLIIYVTKST